MPEHQGKNHPFVACTSNLSCSVTIYVEIEFLFSKFWSNSMRDSVGVDLIQFIYLFFLEGVEVFKM